MGFYRHIYKIGNYFKIIRKGELYGSFRRLEDALYERDRFLRVDWDWDLYVELAETQNNYIHIDLPPFDHKPSFIHKEREYWIVRSKGRNNRRYYGSYHSLEEAERVARIYNANIVHKRAKYRIQIWVNGKSKYFGRYDTLEEAEEKLQEIFENQWRTDRSG